MVNVVVAHRVIVALLNNYFIFFIQCLDCSLAFTEFFVLALVGTKI